MRLMPKNNRTLRLLLVDDHPVVREGMRSWLSTQSGLHIAGEASDGEQAVSIATRVKPDLVLMDIHLPGRSGLEATRVLRERVPKARVLIVTVHYKREFILEAVRSGASGYVLKEAPPEELLEAIEAVGRRGELFFSAPAARLLAQEHVRQSAPDPQGVSRLSNREREVLVAIAGGATSKEIAHRLGLSTRTIETHREGIMRKLDIHTIAGLTRLCIAEGLVELE